MYTIAKPTTRDLHDLLRMERESDMVEIWGASDFLSMLDLPPDDQLALYGLYEGDQIIAYLSTVTRGKTTRLFSLAVTKEKRRRGLGRALVAAVCSRRGHKYATRIRESMVEAQLFFRACGFRCNKIKKDYFNTPPENGYFFSMSHE